MHQLASFVLQPCKVRYVSGWLAKHWSREERNKSCQPAPHEQADPELHSAMQGCTGGAPWSAVQMGVISTSYLG